MAKELRRLGDKIGIHVQAGPESDQPDITFVAQPSLVASSAPDVGLMDLSAYLDMERLRKDYGSYLLSMGTVGAQGSWPSEHGNLYGLPVSLSLKSLIWYPVPEFRRAGYAIPHTWEGLVSLTDRMVADGRTPWCMGLESGDSDGWPATDWIENLLLGGAGPRLYDRWTLHRIPFDHPAVRRAFEDMGDVVFGDGKLYQGVQGSLVTSFEAAQVPMVDSDPPGCWLYEFPSFASATLPPGSVGRTTDAFPFPSPAGHGDAVLGGMTTAVVFTDRPEVREIVRALASPAFAQDWFTSSVAGQFSANQRFDTSAYDPSWRRQAGVLHAALAADTFRLDGGDLMPGVGSGPFWDGMMRYLSGGPDSLDEILEQLEAAWPDDG